MKSNKNYSALASVYEHLMRRIDYSQWALYIYAVTKDYMEQEAPSVLEVASGNCNLARYLKRYYRDIVASDLSIDMLKYNHAESLTKVCCNMTELPFKGKFDLIFSAFDSVNYLLNTRLLLKFLNECSRVLSDAGIITFDVSLESNSYKHIKIKEKESRYNGIKYIHGNSYDAETRIHINSFRFILPGETEVTEVHKQKIYPFEEYFKLIEKTDLYISACYKAFTFETGTKECDRVQFILKKKNNVNI